MAQWEASWREHVADLQTSGSEVPTWKYPASIERMRKLVQCGLLRHTDIRDAPDRFITAHRVLAELATTIGPGFWIRFTVHFNLFAGSVVALGSPEQVAKLDEIQRAGKIGCFGLTEVLAGVNSGLVVNTTCTWVPEKQMFCLNTPDKGANKNWISQGLYADMCVAVADLRVGGKSFGPHAFLIEMRRDGALVEGVTVGDMGVKTVGNDLDNAWVAFQNVMLPKSTLLNRYADVDGDQYVQRVKGIRNMDMIGQRLYTGRMVIARSCMVFARSLYERTRGYTDKKACWAPKGAAMMLSEVPQLAALFDESDANLSRVEAFVSVVERNLSACLVAQTIPDTELVNAVAAAKVKAVETAIEVCWKLKQEVGSYALMAGSGFEQLDYLQCCKFAEGDSRILMQKMSRDRVKAFQKGHRGPEEEAKLCEILAKTSDSKESFVQVYKLAEGMVERLVDQYGKNSAKL